MSCYLDKVRQPRKYDPYFEHWNLLGVSFEEFLDFSEEALKNPDPSTMDEHLRPQSCYYKKEDVDFIVPLEKLSDFMSQRFSIDSLPKLNSSKKLPLELSDLQVQRIKKMYELDYSIEPNF